KPAVIQKSEVLRSGSDFRVTAGQGAESNLAGAFSAIDLSQAAAYDLVEFIVRSSQEKLATHREI
ncbi:MAG TPA: hypothetical protein VF742_08910, partial [Terracidiphilus sp.]